MRFTHAGDAKRTQDDRCSPSLPWPEGSQPSPKTHSTQQASCRQDLREPSLKPLSKSRNVWLSSGRLKCIFLLWIIKLYAHLSENHDLLLVSENIFRRSVPILLSFKTKNHIICNVQVVSSAEIHIVVCYNHSSTICVLDVLVGMFIWFLTVLTLKNQAHVSNLKGWANPS